MGQVYYAVDRCSGIEEMYQSYWKEVVRVEISNEKDLSTTLLICPEFCMDNVELFESFTNTLTQPLVALGVEDLLQLVFFHPLWTFRDGGDRFGAGGAANYARRSPWPMINILRTSQVRAAQKGIPTGLVYTQVRGLMLVALYVLPNLELTSCLWSLHYRTRRPWPRLASTS
jgi:hypothetical protein